MVLAARSPVRAALVRWHARGGPRLSCVPGGGKTLAAMRRSQGTANQRGRGAPRPRPITSWRICPSPRALPIGGRTWPAPSTEASRTPKC